MLNGRFVKYGIPDTSVVDITKLVVKLPHPTIGTEWAVGLFTFKFCFSRYNMGWILILDSSRLINFATKSVEKVIAADKKCFYNI